MAVHLDIGCGATPTSRTGPGLAVGVDVDLDALVRSPRRHHGWNAVAADGLALPVATGSIASIRLEAVLHHITPTEAAVTELSRCLAAGGSLTISDGTALDAADVRQLNDELIAAGRPPEPITGFELSSLTDALERTGLTVDDVSFDGVAIFATPPFVSRRYESPRFVLHATRARARPG